MIEHVLEPLARLRERGGGEGTLESRPGCSIASLTRPSAELSRKRERRHSMLAAIVRSSLAHPRIVTALSVLIAVLGAAALLAARFDVFPDFAPPHVLVQTETPGTRRDAGRSARDASARRPARRHRKRAHRALDVEPGLVGDPRDLRSRRRSVSAAPGRDRTACRSERAPARRRRARRSFRRCPRRWNISSISASPATSSRRSDLRDLIEWVDQAADSRRAGRRAGADLRRRSARAADRDRSAQARRERAHARRCRAGDAPRDGADRRRLHRNLDAAHRRAGAGRRRDTGSARAGRSSRRATACRCGSAMSRRSATAPSRASATR